MSTGWEVRCPWTDKRGLPSSLGWQGAVFATLKVVASHPVFDEHSGHEARQTSPNAVWSGLDNAWQEAFRQAWEAFRTGNIAVGACATTPAGAVVHAARNRVVDGHAPLGEVFGSSLAHAEANVVARLTFRSRKELVLTTTLEPCLQCSAVVRLGPVASVRFAGADPLWDGCHDFSPLSRREAARTQVKMIGPRDDEVGVFGNLISRFWDHGPAVQEFLRANGEAESLDLVRELKADGVMPMLAAMEVEDAFAYLWPRLRGLSPRSKAV